MNLILELILISAAISSISITLTQTYLFNRFRESLKSYPLLFKLFHCPYCLSHYLSFLFTLINYPLSQFIIYSFALITFSSIFAFPVLLYLNELEKENEFWF